MVYKGAYLNGYNSHLLFIHEMCSFLLNLNESSLKDLYDSVSIPRAEQHSFLRAIYA